MLAQRTEIDKQTEPQAHTFTPFTKKHILTKYIYIYIYNMYLANLLSNNSAIFFRA